MIKVLKKQVADKIAAGEVVERPVSIVKELLENSLDAGASNIVIEIKKGGKEYIRVTDDGCGIPEDEVETAFKRHATSKIEEAEDLGSLETLGFRGEALASIAAVSRVEMITKPRGQKTGLKIDIEGGIVMESGATGCPEGTTVIVRDLFYNTPAREKFMKSDSRESGMVTGLVDNVALAYPDVRIRMINNGRILFATRGTGDRLTAIASVEGAEHVRDLVPVNAEENGMQLEGYVSGPGVSRASRRFQVYFVNGRAVASKVMEKGVSLAYSDRLFAGRYPEVYLFLTIDPGILDVNIHPNKRMVRFDDDVAVSAFIRNAVVRALSLKDAVPGIHTAALKTSVAPGAEEPSANSVRHPAKHEQQGRQTDFREVLQQAAEEKEKVKEERQQYRAAIERKKIPPWSILIFQGSISGESPLTHILWRPMMKTSISSTSTRHTRGSISSRSSGDWNLMTVPVSSCCRRALLRLPFPMRSGHCL